MTTALLNRFRAHTVTRDTTNRANRPVTGVGHELATISNAKSLFMTGSRPVCSASRRGSRSASLLISFCLFIGAGNGVFADINIAQYSRVTSTPYVGAAIAYLTDGKIAAPNEGTLMLAAPLPIRIGQEMP